MSLLLDVASIIALVTISPCGPGWMSTSMFGKRSLNTGSTPRAGSSQRCPADTSIVTLPVILSSVYQPGPMVSALAKRVPAPTAAVAAIICIMRRREIAFFMMPVCSIVCLYRSSLSVLIGASPVERIRRDTAFAGAG